MTEPVNFAGPKTGVNRMKSVATDLLNRFWHANKWRFEDENSVDLVAKWKSEDLDYFGKRLANPRHSGESDAAYSKRLRTYERTVKYFQGCL